MFLNLVILYQSKNKIKGWVFFKEGCFSKKKNNNLGDFHILLLQHLPVLQMGGMHHKDM